jgi:uncharacterized protein with HEPN domain
MPRDDAARIRDIVDAARRIRAHCEPIDHAAFVANDVLMRAVLYDLAVIGEAAKGVSEATRARLRDVPWSDMAGMRDVVIHQYFGIDGALAWRAASVSVPRLLRALERTGG